MRTTVTLDDDVAAAVERIRRERGVGVSQAINELVRAGLAVKPTASGFRQPSVSIGVQVEGTNVAEALEQLDGPSAR
jgi:hypothetical protein